MTQDQLDLILALPKIEDQIKALSVSSFDIPKWTDLEKQYDPDKHAIKKDLTRYPIITNASTGGDDMKRITRALQRLAVHRMSQIMGVTPVKRSYTYDSNSQQDAVDVIEEIYKVHNNIDAENIERFKMNNASCQVATVWRVLDEENTIKEYTAKLKLAHTSYSEIDGYKIYANIDNNRNLLVISFSYKDSSDIEYFDIYIGGLNPEFRSYTKKEAWVLTEMKENPKKLDFFPVSYTHLKQPVWGGDSGTDHVETIEETTSYRAMYIKKNSVPLATIDYGKISGRQKATGTETDEDKRRLIELGEGGKLEYVVWDVNNGTSEQQIKDALNAFFDDNQIPNISLSELIKSNASAENKELMLTDSKSRALDLGGEWEKLFNEELNKIVIPFAKVMFPSLAKDFETISVRSKIVPFSIKTDKENSELIANAGNAMSLKTKVDVLNLVDDKVAEVERIEAENAANANQGL